MAFVKDVTRAVAALGLGFAVAATAMTVAANAQAQAPAAAEFQPHVGQAGKDVIWVPTALAMVNKMLDVAKVTPQDVLIDLGSGDGRTVITAAKRGLTAHGIEYNPDMVDLSRRNAAREGVADRATFAKADLFESDFSKAAVITMFLLSDINLRLRPTLLAMAPGTRIVSNTFDMGDWQADEKFEAKDGCTSYCRGFFWVVPAKVEGTWTVNGGKLELTQTFQIVSGKLTSGNVMAPIINGRVTGNKIAFSAGATQYTGQIAGTRIEGIARTGETETTWQAVRTP